MTTNIHTFKLNLNFKILGLLSSIDRFGGEWVGIERREGHQTLKQLKSIATVHSVWASTRIEGSRMTNDEVREFIFNNIKIEKLVERDKQEVLGYFNVLDIISESYLDIDITENSLMNLHNQLMKYSDKDQYHKGKYKINTNSVEATHPDGTKTIIFNTTPPGIETQDAMRGLIEWYRNDNTTPPVIKSAIFVYDFLSIHPFQDGNGRLSRLLGTLLLLKHGYPWIQYVSFEHEIEHRKAEYYRILMDCQQNRPGEDVAPWLLFFLDCLNNIQNNLKKKLETQKSENQLSPRDKMIYTFVESHPGCKSGEISKKLNIPLPTVKKLLAEMVEAKLLSKYGAGSGTNYTTEKLTKIKTDVAQTFTSDERSKDFILLNRYAFVTIKKIILSPKFEWKKPDDWSNILLQQNLQLMITCYNSKGAIRSQSYIIDTFTTVYHYQPIFTLNTPIHIPLSLLEKEPFDNEYPIKVVIELKCREMELKFDVMLVYDAALE
jgi:Fic family protein